ncbi:MAG: hypothetical protein AAB134_08195 [Pseudomonadota bacterium]
MKIDCPSCHSVIKLKQKYQYHIGFSNLGVLYCDSHSELLMFSTYNPIYREIIGAKHPWTLSEKEKAKVEENLKPCSCGGRFRFDAPPRCPVCNASLASLLKDKLHYIEVGKVVDGDKDDVWLFKHAQQA